MNSTNKHFRRPMPRSFRYQELNQPFLYHSPSNHMYLPSCRCWIKVEMFSKKGLRVSFGTTRTHVQLLFLSAMLPLWSQCTVYITVSQLAAQKHAPLCSTMHTKMATAITTTDHTTHACPRILAQVSALANNSGRGQQRSTPLIANFALLGNPRAYPQQPQRVVMK